VGTTGVVAPQEATGLEPLTDAATTYSLVHQMSARDSISASGTGAWIDQPALGATASSSIGKYQEVTGGADVDWKRALNTRELLGIELNDVYVKGISPSGMSNFGSAKITFGQTLTPHSSVSAGAGPLLTHSGLQGTPTTNETTYTANADFRYERAFGHIDFGYERLYELGYLFPTTVASQLYCTVNRQITSKVFLTADSRFLRSPNEGTLIGYSRFAFTARLDVSLTPNLAYRIEGLSFVQGAGNEPAGYHENQLTTGLTYVFGSPSSRLGVGR
jgi:hypothetical protein